MIRAACLVFAALAALPAAAQQKVLADRSEIKFVTRQMNVPVEGRFKRFDATVSFDPAKPEATRAEFEVDVTSLDFGHAESESEAKKKGWLDTSAFPKARFVASSVKALGGNRFEAAGELTLKGVGRAVVAPFTLAESGGLRTVEGQFALKRLQFRVGEGAWSDTDTVADEVVVKFRFVLPAK